VWLVDHKNLQSRFSPRIRAKITREWPWIAQATLILYEAAEQLRREVGLVGKEAFAAMMAGEGDRFWYGSKGSGGTRTTLASCWPGGYWWRATQARTS
jgi:hypothetical protein